MTEKARSIHGSRGNSSAGPLQAAPNGGQMPAIGEDRMTDATEATSRASLGRIGSPHLVWIRLAIGLLQGAALWWLYRSTHGPHHDVLERTWPATVPELFGPLAMILVMVPVLLLAGVGRMRWPVLLGWIAVAAAFLGLLGWHGVAAQSIS